MTTIDIQVLVRNINLPFNLDMSSACWILVLAFLLTKDDHIEAQAGCINTQNSDNYTAKLNFTWPKIRDHRHHKIIFTEKYNSQLLFNIVDPCSFGGEGLVIDGISVQSELNGRHLKVATILWPPHTMMDSNTGELYGFCIDVLDELSRLLKFGYTLEQPADGEWGILKKNGWSGLVGLLQRKEVDMVAAPLTFHTERSRVMEFSFPFDTTQSRMWLLDPKGRQARWLVLFDLLDLPTTLLVCTSILALAFLLTFTAYLAQIYDRKQTESVTWQYCTNIFYLFAALLRQSLGRLPFSDAGKTFLVSLYLFSITFSAMYSARLVAILTTNSTATPFNTIAELTRQTEYKYGYLGKSVEELIFYNSPRQDMKNAWQGIKRLYESDPTVLSTNVSIHISKIFSEKYVYIGSEMPWYKNRGKMEEYPIVGGREVFATKANSFGLPLGSNISIIISKGLMDLQAYGVLQMYRRKWWPSLTSRNVNKVNSARSIPWQTVRGAFYAITVGIAACVVVLLLEIAHMYLVKRRISR